MVTKNQLVYGTDPEFFAGYVKDDKIFVLPSVWFRMYGGIEYIPDIKHPIIIDKMDELGVKIIEDGVAFEETVLPDTDWKSLFDRVQIGKSLLLEMVLSKFPKDCLQSVLSLPTIGYEIERWRKENAEFKICNIFGCDRDYDAEEGNKESVDVNASRHPYRYGGGHIHVSGSEFIKNEPILAISALKMTAGLAAVAFSSTPELDKMRTYLYGRPTKYRPQRYSGLFNGIPNTDFGVEYRTPSNAWTSSFEHAEKVFKWIEIGIRNILEGGLVLELKDKIGKESSDAIINCDQILAKDLLSFVESKV